MKRRDFLASSTATAFVPLLPSIGLSGTGPIHPNLYAKAAHWAGLWADSSAKTLQSVFYLDDQTASMLFTQLQSNKVIGKPNALGISKVLKSTLEPLNTVAKLHPSKRKANTAEKLNGHLNKFISEPDTPTDHQEDSA